MFVIWLAGYIILLLKTDPVPTSTLHYYYYITGTDSTSFTVRNGIFEYSGETLEKKQMDDLSEWKIAVKNELKKLPEDKNKILFHIHGFMADNEQFVKKSGFTLQKEYYDAEGSPYGLIISLQWSAPADYPKTRPLALQKGKAFGALIAEIHSWASDQGLNTQFSFICHSMGNRVLEGVFNGISENSAYQNLKYDQLFLMAADVESDIFQNQWKLIPQVCNEIHVYRNLNDRTLAMANVFVPYKRLGIFGPDEQSLTAYKNLNVTDVSDMDDDETFAGRLSLHRYYYSSPSVRKKVISQIFRTAGIPD